jgi:hypothetical protein
MDHHVDTGEDHWIHQPPRRHLLAEQAEVGVMLDGM